MTGNVHKLKKERFRLDAGKNLFHIRTIKEQHNLPREVLSLDVLKTGLDKALNNLV